MADRAEEAQGWLSTPLIATLIAVALVVASVEVGMLVEFGEQSAIAGSKYPWLVGLAYGGVAVAKLACLPAAHVSASQGFLGRAIVFGAIWLVLVGVALDVCFSRDVAQRSATVGTYDKAQATLTELRRERDMIEARLKAIKEPRSLAAIDGEIAAKKATYLWRGSKGCTTNIEGKLKSHCDDLAALEAARSRAADADAVRRRLAELGPMIADAAKVVPLVDATMDAKILASMTGWSELAIAGWRSLKMPAVLTLLPDLLLWGAAGIIGRRRKGELRWKREDEALVHGAWSTARPGTTLDEPSIDAPGRAIEAQIPVVLGRPAGPVRNPAENSASRAIGRVSATGPDHPPKRSSSNQPPASSTQSSLAGGQDDRKAAVVAFVGQLDRDQSGRVSGAELFAAYRARRPIHGGPNLSVTEFGTLAREAVIAVGGRKGRSNGVVYTGVSIPASWKLHAVANSNSDGA